MPLKFAISRADYDTEILLLKDKTIKKALISAKLGCTGLALMNQFPDLEVVFFDNDSDQLTHLKEKIELIEKKDLAALNIENDDINGYSQNGAIEKLFRVMRFFMDTYIVPKDEIFNFFKIGSDVVPEVFCDKLMSSVYWDALFKCFFNNDFLSIMLESLEYSSVTNDLSSDYANYFKERVNKALLKENAQRNPWLHSVFLGYYLKSDAPPFLTSGKKFEPVLRQAQLHEIEDLDSYELIALPNVFDHSREHMVRLWAERLRDVAPGTIITYRLFNNIKSYKYYFEPWFTFDDEFCNQLSEQDRGFYYNTVEIAVRNFKK